MNSYDRYLQEEAERWREDYENPEEDYSDPVLDELATKMFAKYIKKENE